jgi:hypothetical protein
MLLGYEDQMQIEHYHILMIEFQLLHCRIRVILHFALSNASMNNIFLMCYKGVK